MMNTLRGVLLSTHEARAWIEGNLSGELDSVDLCCAYIKRAALEHLANVMSELRTTVPVRILARWRLTDLITGASDLEAFELARSKGWSFYIKQDYHGKLYRLDPAGILVGSANLTSSGLGLLPSGNDEISVCVESDSLIKRQVEAIFGSSRLVTDSLYELIKEVVERSDPVRAELPDWPLDLIQLIDQSKPSISDLFVDEFLFSFSPSALLETNHVSLTMTVQHDLSVLGIPKNIKLERSMLKWQFLQSKGFRWLYGTVQSEGGEAYFGRLSMLLHDSLLDDPAPYRSNVKVLLSNLLNWATELDCSELIVDKPNYSQRVRTNNLEG